MASAEEIFVSLRQRGYPEEQALAAAKAGTLPDDPIESLWAATVQQESGGNQAAVSPKGAIGRAQILPSTGPVAAALAGQPWDLERLKTDPAYNEALGQAYLRQQVKDFGSPELGLAAYNAGPGAVRRAGGDLSKLPKETRDYVPRILERVAMATQNAAPTAEPAAANDPAEDMYVELIKQGVPDDRAMLLVSLKHGLPLSPAQTQAATPSIDPAIQQAALQESAPYDPRQNPIAQSSQWLNDQANQSAQTQGTEGLFGFKQGVTRGAASLLNGLGQLGTYVGGDDTQRLHDYLGQLQASQNQAAAQYNRPGSGLNAQDFGTAAPDVALGLLTGGLGNVATKGKLLAELLTSAAKSAGIGAVEGAVKGTENDWQRLGNLLVGGGVGGVAGAVPSVLQAFGRLLSDPLPEEARDVFYRATYGGTRGDPVIAQTQDVPRLLGERLSEANKQYVTKLNEARSLAGNALIPLENTARGTTQGLDVELARNLDSDVGKLLDSVADIAGRGPASFDSINEIRRIVAKRRDEFNLAGNKTGGDQAQAIINNLDADIAAFGATSEQAQKAAEAYQQSQRLYATDVAPRKNTLKTITPKPGTTQSTEGLMQKFLFPGAAGPGAGTNVAEVLRQAPETLSALRRLHAEYGGEFAGNTKGAKLLQGNSSAEPLLSADERAYEQYLAEKLLNRGAGTPGNGLKGLLQDTLGTSNAQSYEKFIRNRGGMNPTTSALANLLRAGAAPAALQSPALSAAPVIYFSE